MGRRCRLSAAERAGGRRGAGPRARLADALHQAVVAQREALAVRPEAHAAVEVVVAREGEHREGHALLRQHPRAGSETLSGTRSKDASEGPDNRTLRFAGMAVRAVK